jgi:hypothetical protein
VRLHVVVGGPIPLLGEMVSGPLSSLQLVLALIVTGGPNPFPSRGGLWATGLTVTYALASPNKPPMG